MICWPSLVLGQSSLGIWSGRATIDETSLPTLTGGAASVQKKRLALLKQVEYKLELKTGGVYVLSASKAPKELSLPRSSDSGNWSESIYAVTLVTPDTSAREGVRREVLLKDSDAKTLTYRMPLREMAAWVVLKRK
jgi:hypothetical protein